MLFDNLPLPLPWYKGISPQDRFRQNVASDAVITQLAPKDGILPFQFRKPSTSAIPVTWKIKCAENIPLLAYLGGYSDTVVCDLSDYITSALTWFSRVDPDDSSVVMDYFIFKNELNSLDMITPTLADGLLPGIYYMEMYFGLDGGDTWCSETFRVPDDRFNWNTPTTECNYPCFRWSHNSDIKQIYYYPTEPYAFYNILYLDTFITASEPVYEVQGETDGNNEFHSTFEKMVIKYRLSSCVPDYIKIALYTMQLHENKFLFTERGLRQGDIKNLEISSTLSTDGGHSFVEMLFEQMSLFVKTGCSNSMVEPDSYELGDTPALDSTFCEPTGDVYVKITDTLPAGIYGQLYFKVGSVYFPSGITYISRHDLLAGYSGNIGMSSGAIAFKVKLRTFSFDVGESAESIPVASC